MNTATAIQEKATTTHKAELFALSIRLKQLNKFDEASLVRSLILGHTIRVTPFMSLWLTLCNYQYVTQDFQLIGRTGAVVFATYFSNH